MRKAILRLAVAVVTLEIGIASATLFPVIRWRRFEVPKPSVIKAAPQSRTPEGWTPITIGRVSFYRPPALQRQGPPGNAGVVEAFAGESSKDQYLYLYYAYGKTIPSDANPSAGESTLVVIDGKVAKINTFDIDWAKRGRCCKLEPVMILVVSDVGDGNKFEIYADSFNRDVMKQILDSVEIR